ncbi:MAG: ferrous iron transport protein A, partial [Clostridia bacterium]|nr:ferrous iron transport protein A [Clostridia bacterium]
MKQLDMVPKGTYKIAKVNGLNFDYEEAEYLHSMGFLVGSEIEVVSQTMVNTTVNIKGTKLVLDKGVASDIYVEE